MHEENCFITLTYNDENLPLDGGLSLRDLQLFMKRLRKAIAPTKVRFYACGEYGDDNLRPHFHIVLFGFEFGDRTPHRVTANDHIVYRSATLERLWPYGFSELGSVTRASGGYVARYVLKKITGHPAEDHYRRPHPVTGELFDVRPEFACMSIGIARDWFDKYEGDAFPSDFLVVEGVKVPVPPYFAKKLKGRNADDDALIVRDDFSDIRKKRKAFASDPRNIANSSPERLAVREEVLEHKLKLLKREL